MVVMGAGSIQHVQSSTRVLLRLQRQYVLLQEPMGEVRITGIVYLPEQAGDPVASPMLRNLPTSRIEAAINRRQFAVTRHHRILRGWHTHDALRPHTPLNRGHETVGEPEAHPGLRPVLSPCNTPASSTTGTGPTARMAEISRVPLSTAQGWVARARSKGLLPPGRRGRAG